MPLKILLQFILLLAIMQEQNGEGGLRTAVPIFSSQEEYVGLLSVFAYYHGQNHRKEGRLLLL